MSHSIGVSSFTVGIALHHLPYAVKEMSQIGQVGAWEYIYIYRRTCVAPRGECMRGAGAARIAIRRDRAAHVARADY